MDRQGTAHVLHQKFRSLSVGDVEPVDFKETLAAAHAYIGDRKKAFQTDGNPHVCSAATMLDRTLCLASNFNQGGSKLSSFALEGQGAGHYIRSFAHDLLIANKLNQAPVKRLVSKDKGHADALAANVGRIPNVSTLALSRLKRLTAEGLGQRPETSAAGSGELYDASLAYRTQVTEHIATELGGTQHIKVGAYNDYPAVMVHFDARTLLKDFRPKDDLSTPAASFNEFLMSHYLGIVNAEAAKMGLDTATVERSSFGHLTPSVAATGESFRINLGMMPPAYAQAHINALALLDRELGSFEKSLGQNHGVDRTTFERSEHRGALQKDQDILRLAFTKVEKRGKTLMTSATRTLQARNAVDGASFQHHIGNAADNNPIGTTLSALFSFVKVEENGKVSTKATPISYEMSTTAATAAAAPALESEALANSYQNYLKKFSDQLSTIAEHGENTTTNEHINALAKTLTPKNPDIATALDVANQLLMVHTLDRMKANLPPAADAGYGSESDIEDDALEGNKKIEGNKIIVHNGMRSLIGATDSARAILFDGRKKIQIAYEHPYYETQNAITQTGIRVEENKDKNAKAEIVIKDINACITDRKSDGASAGAAERKPDAGANKTLAESFPDARVWIIDTTSADTDQMRDIYQQFKHAGKAELLYLASSGLKNEQAGADQNNYGTLRVFAKTTDGETDKPIVGRVMGAIAETDKGLAQFAHEHRRTMKAMGMVPRNEQIVLPVRSDVVMADFPGETD